MWRSDAGYDYAILDRGGHVVSAIEVKAVRNTDGPWAAHLIQNYLGPRLARPAEYFLLVTPEWIYLWHFPQESLVDRASFAPDWKIDAKPVLAPYFERVTSDPETIIGSAFDLLVGGWLGHLLMALEHEPQSISIPEPLLKSGWIDAIQRGQLKYEPAA